PSCGTECLVIKAFDGRLFTSVNDKMYLLEELDEHEKFSKEFDRVKIKVTKKKKKWIPPMSHPWKMKSYEAYLRRVESEKKYAYV
ncbi:MAG: transposase, partial [Enterococcus sp.]|nr:transposase [Enterococcus sp.]